jgi:deoxyribonuclease V
LEGLVHRWETPGAAIMDIPLLHTWDLTPTQAVALQRELAGRVDTSAPLVRGELIAGADVSYNRFSTRFYAAVVVLRASDWSIVEVCSAVRDHPFPYVPGLLSFREAPALLDAFAKLRTTPDAVMFDGQGLAHPRRFGLACHVGLWLGIPCLGCAKSVLVGTHKRLGVRAGAVAALVDKKEVIGHAVRTKRDVRPVFVSAGHRIDLPSAARLVLAACRGYRLPEPTRQAHLYVNELRRQHLGAAKSPEA